MRAIKYTIICILAGLAIVGCGRGTGEEGLTHDEVAAINERVLEKASLFKDMDDGSTIYIVGTVVAVSTLIVGLVLTNKKRKKEE